MDVVIRLRVRIEMHWPLFSIGTLKLALTLAQPINTTTPNNQYDSHTHRRHILEAAQLTSFERFHKFV